MNCVRCSQPIHPGDDDDDLMLIMLDYGPSHPFCCTKEELVQLLCASSRERARLFRTAYDYGEESWWSKFKRRHLRRKRRLTWPLGWEE